jgi:hypothetical protein
MAAFTRKAEDRGLLTVPIYEFAVCEFEDLPYCDCPSGDEWHRLDPLLLNHSSSRRTQQSGRPYRRARSLRGPFFLWASSLDPALAGRTRPQRRFPSLRRRRRRELGCSSDHDARWGRYARRKRALLVMLLVALQGGREDAEEMEVGCRTQPMAIPRPDIVGDPGRQLP